MSSPGAPTVCIDCRYLRERPSGIATIVQALVDHLPDLAPDLRFLFLKHRLAPLRLATAANVSEVVLRAEANGPGTLFWLPALVDLRGVDVFHCPFNLLPHGLSMPTVVTVNDVMWLRHPALAQAPSWWRHVERPFYRHGITHALRRATRIIAISRATEREIVAVAPEAASRVRVVLEGVSTAFTPERECAAEIERVKRRLLPGVPRFVLSVGQFRPYKNHERVLRAFARAFRDQPDVHLVLVQRLGEGERFLDPMARTLGVAARVHFLRDVPWADLLRLYQGAMVYCHPSLYEGFGNGPAEAMAAGCPVVTSNCSSMPEVTAGAALLVDPESVSAIADALIRVAHEPVLAADLCARGLARAKELSWRACAEGTLAVYRELLESSNGAS